jgi:preprotein translocase subunit SecG
MKAGCIERPGMAMGVSMVSRAAAKVVGKILAKFIPVVGWIWLIGAIIWAFAEEFI